MPSWREIEAEAINRKIKYRLCFDRLFYLPENYRHVGAPQASTCRNADTSPLEETGWRAIRISGGAEYRGAEWQVIKKLRPTGISGGLNVGSRLLPQSCIKGNPPSDAAGFDIIT